MEQLDNQPTRAGSSAGRSMTPVAIGATSEMVVPNKSRMREEEIEVPYARDSVLEAAPSIRSRSRTSQRDRDRDRDRDRESQISAGTSISARQQLPAQQQRQPSAAASASAPGGPPSRPLVPADTLSPTMTDDREYYDRMSFSSNVTGKSRLGLGTNGAGWDEEREQKIRQEYEFRVAGLERKLGIVEAEKEELKRAAEGSRDMRAGWEEEVRGLKEVSVASCIPIPPYTVHTGRQRLSMRRSGAE